MFSWLGSLFNWFGSLIHDFAVWLLGIVQSVFQWLWDQLLAGLVALLAAIPVPEFLGQASGALGSVPAGVVYLLAPFQVGAGISIVLAAYVLRFLIRRLPIIG